MMPLLNVYKLGELFQIRHGYAFKGQYFSNAGPFIVVTPGNFHDGGGFKAKTQEKYYTGVVPAGYLLNKGDLIIAMTEQAEGLLGSSAVVPADNLYLHNQRIGLVTDLEKSLVDVRFLYYLFNTPWVRAQIRATANGAKVRHTSPSRIYEVEVSIPSLPIQRRIASILSAYDDLIENNTRRIAILEEMARRIYEEWFVNFRFPGRERAQFQESELGPIPAHWPLVRLDQSVSFNPRTKVPKDGEKLFAPMSALSETNMVVGALEMKSGNSGAKFQNGDTLVARISPCIENGKTGFVDFLPKEQPSACGSTEFIVLRSKTLCPSMVYCMARSSRFRDIAIKSMSGATGRQRVRTESLEGMMFAQPDKDTIAKFDQFASPVFSLVKNLATRNVNLRAQRDMLLPKLISGQIDLSEAEEIAKEDVA